MLLLQDWNYKMQLKLRNVFVRDVPKTTKTDIYDETVTHVVLIHGSAEDCQLRKIYKAPFLIPVTCHQVHSRQASHRPICSFPPSHNHILIHTRVHSQAQCSLTAFAFSAL